ncbi:MAG: DUF1934 domain-containing protein [Ruminococcaceae bacterium]|nr:DUF1934 domain-containing protein [Oscillospiraceae bacterium]
MNDKNYLITIRGLQTYADDPETNDVELITEGDFFVEDGKYFIKYSESEVTGMEGTTTHIEADGDYVALMREGTVNTRLIFMKDKRTTTYYETPYGTLSVGVKSDKLDTSLNEHGGTILVDYTIDINNCQSGHNQFQIHVKEV